MLLLLDILTFLFGFPEAPDWLPLISVPSVLIGIVGLIISMLASGECTCAFCMAVRHEQKVQK